MNPQVWTYRELLDGGMTRASLQREVRDGALIHLRRGVYARNGCCAEAMTAARHGGGLACVSAARHLGLWTPEDVPAENSARTAPATPGSAIHVWMRAHGRRRDCAAPCSCVEHWDDAGALGAFGLPSVPRMLRQILRCRGVETFFVVLESALRQGRLGKAGLAWLRAHTNDQARDAIALAGRDSDSGLESLLKWRLRAHGLRIRSQITITGVGRVDFLIGDRLIIELDGKEHHGGRSNRHRDLRRDAAAATRGYVTLRFDYAMVIYQWDTVEAAILSHVAAGRHLQPEPGLTT